MVTVKLQNTHPGHSTVSVTTLWGALMNCGNTTGSENTTAASLSTAAPQDAARRRPPEFSLQASHTYPQSSLEIPNAHPPATGSAQILQMKAATCYRRATKSLFVGVLLGKHLTHNPIIGISFESRAFTHVRRHATTVIDLPAPLHPDTRKMRLPSDL